MTQLFRKLRRVVVQAREDTCSSMVGRNLLSVYRKQLLTLIKLPSGLRLLTAVLKGKPKNLPGTGYGEEFSRPARNGCNCSFVAFFWKCPLFVFSRLQFYSKAQRIAFPHSHLPPDACPYPSRNLAAGPSRDASVFAFRCSDFCYSAVALQCVIFAGFSSY